MKRASAAHIWFDRSSVHLPLRATLFGFCTGKPSLTRTLKLISASLFFAFAARVDAAHQRTQHFELETGWNAIYLCVEPVDSSPDAVFVDTAVDLVAVFDAARNTGQFSSNPNIDMLRQLGWGMWYAPQREDSFLTSIGAIHGNKAYLVHATEAFTLNITGYVEQAEAWWKPNAFNLVGYTLDANAPPTFEQFFSGSPAHSGQEVFRLEDGIWKRILEPSSTAMRDGEAFWIYCDGPSDYPGPLAVTTDSLSGMVFDSGRVNVYLKNLTSFPLQPSLEHVLSGSDAVPLAIVIDGIDEEGGKLVRIPVPMGSGAWQQILPPLSEGASIRIPFEAITADINVPEAKTLLCIKTDLGTELWLPVTGLREDLK